MRVWAGGVALVIGIVTLTARLALADGVFIQQRDANGKLLFHREVGMSRAVYGGAMRLNLAEGRLALVDLARIVEFDLALSKIFAFGPTTGEFEWAFEWGKNGAFVVTNCDTVEKHGAEGGAEWRREFRPGFVGGVMHGQLGDSGEVSVGPTGVVAVAGNIGACEASDPGLESWSTSPTPIELIVLTPDGQILWEHVYEDATLYSDGVHFAPDGRLAVLYWQPKGDRAGIDLFDEAGEGLWRAEWTDFSPVTLLFDQSGALYVAGRGAEDEGLLKKIDPDGGEEWSALVAESHDSLWPSRTFERDDSIVLTGKLHQDGTVLLCEVTKAGEVVWETRKGDPGTGALLAAVEQDDAGFVLAGRTVPLGGKVRTGPFVWRFSSYGKLLWELDRENHGLDVGQEVSDIAADEDGNIWIAGTYASDDEEKEKGCGC